MLPDVSVLQAGGLSAFSSLCYSQTLVVKATGRPFPDIHWKDEVKPSGRAGEVGTL